MATEKKTASRHAAAATKTSDLESKVAGLEADIAALRKELAAVKAAKAAPAAEAGGSWVSREEWGTWRRVVAKKIGVRL